MPEQDSATTDVNPMDSLDFNEEAETEAVEQETTTEDSSTEENKETDQTTEEETEGEQETESEEDNEEEQTEETDNEGESKAKNSAQNRIRSLANENRALKQQVESLNAQFYKPQSAEELQEQGMEVTDAKIEAMRQERLIDQANAHITALNTDINMEALQVTHDYPIFDPDSKDYDKDFAAMVGNQWVQASGVTTDQNTGFITQARVLPYDFYKSYAEARELGMKRGAINGKKSAEKTANAADLTPVATSKDEKKDPLMEALLAD